MNRFLRRPFIAIMLGTACLCLAWSDTWDGIRAAAGNVTSVQAAFVQHKYLPILAKPLESTGALYYQAPESLRWEYVSPIQSVLLMHDGHVRRLIKDDNGFKEEANAGLDAMQVVLQQITHWLNGQFEDDPMFAPELRPDGLIVLTPRNDALKTVLQRIELYLGQEPGMIRQVKIFEGPDAYTELTFSQTILNRKLAPEVFQRVK